MAIQFVNDPKPNAAAVTAPAESAPVETPAAAGPSSADELKSLRETIDSLMGKVNALSAPKEAAAPEAGIEAKAAPEADLLAQLLADPESAMEAVLTKREKRVAEERQALLDRVEQANSAIRAVHPDLDAITEAGQFRKWVELDPTRKAMMARSDREIDPSARIVLLSLFKAAESTAAPVDSSRKSTDEEVKAREKAAKASGPAKGAAPSVAAKTYRRVDIQALAAANPEQYRAMLPEIRRAYLEGRVKG